MSNPSRPVLFGAMAVWSALSLGAVLTSCGPTGETTSASGTGGGAATTAGTSSATGSSTSASGTGGTGSATSSTASGSSTGTGGSPPPDVRVLTQHDDNLRTGANLKETVLTPSNVEVSKFGMLFARPVDDQIYAQPLYVPGVTIPGKGVHNVVYVATMADTVYAFDADDPAASDPLWKTSFIDPANGVTPVDHLDVGGACGVYADISGNIGILSTPVIDEAAATIYLVAKTKEAGGKQVYRLHALDLATGAERANSPVKIQGSVPGSGDGSTNGTLAFDPAIENQRSAVTLAAGQLYVAFAGYCDTGPYHGWIFAYDAKTFALTHVFNATPDGWAGGIWMSGQGLSVDASGDLFLLTGNGNFNADAPGGVNFGCSAIRLDPSLKIVDWFTPHDVDALNAADLDLGSSGVLLLPTGKLAMGGGKGGYMYVWDRDNLGLWNPTDDSQIVQSFQVTNAHIHGSPVVWDVPNGPLVYLWGEYGHLNGYQLENGQFKQVGQSMKPVPDGMPGGMLSVSANGTKPGTGIVWATHPLIGDANQAVRPGILEAFDAADLTNPLWNTQMNAARDDFGSFAKFCPPTIANGKVYLATFSNQLAVYGIGDFSGPCFNGVQDPGETNVDCGGACKPCMPLVTTCPGGQSMDVGETFDCDLGAVRTINATGISVGCNDGEMGDYALTFDQGGPTNLTAACNSSFPIPSVSSRYAHLTMTAGGGGDMHISFNSSGGWSITHF